MINDKHPHTSVNDAKWYAEDEQKLFHPIQRHAYVYELGGQYFVYWHFENKYIDSYIPLGSQILWHAEVTIASEDGEWVTRMTWERRGNHTNYEFDAIAEALGLHAANVLKDMGVINTEIVNMDDKSDANSQTK